MTTLLMALMMLMTSQSFAKTFALKKALPTFPSHLEPELASIWDKCINKSEEISFISPDAISLLNSSTDCDEFGLKEVPFRLEQKKFLLDLTPEMNPFSKLRNSKVSLYVSFRKSVNQIQLRSNINFIPHLIIDVRLNATYKDHPYDYFISQRMSEAGWEKIGQELMSTETHTELCRPRIYCTSIIKTYKQTWKDNQSGIVTESIFKESN